MVTKSISIKSKGLTPCKDYKVHGKWLGWHDNGNKCIEWNYKDGWENGNHITWFNHGVKRFEKEYNNGKLINKIL